MAEKIYTIPINEAFDQLEGCPLCRLHSTLDAQSVSYVMGAAMMEPDVRIRTNQLGFCSSHFSAMKAMKNRLSLALILESHLDTVAGQFPTGELSPSSRLGSKLKKFHGDDQTAQIAEQAASCYVCTRVAEFEARYTDNIVYLWKKEAAFREKLQKQPCFCLPHYVRLLEQARGTQNEESFLQVRKALTRVMTD